MKDAAFWLFVTVMVAFVVFEDEFRCHFGNKTSCAIIAIVDAKKIAEASK